MQGRVVWMCRARGFKDHGEYETIKGFEVLKLGHTITAIFDYSAHAETGFISCFAEPLEAATEFLIYKRGRYSKNNSTKALITAKVVTTHNPINTNRNGRR